MRTSAELKDSNDVALFKNNIERLRRMRGLNIGCDAHAHVFGLNMLSADGKLSFARASLALKAIKE